MKSKYETGFKIKTNTDYLIMQEAILMSSIYTTKLAQFLLTACDVVANHVGGQQGVGQKNQYFQSILEGSKRILVLHQCINSRRKLLITMK